jgi:isopentenyl-diphosphate delta-isomerase
MREVEELVVLLAPDGTPSGQAPKATVHHASTPLHLAFSCWVFDPEGRVLLTQRAAGKATWPLVWTNTFCGHPAPEEDPAGAVLRRAGQELGLGLRDLQLVLPDFRYTATMDNGLV